jgi:hypothetical protein
MKELENKRVIVLGHYGSGKTNFAVNLALQRRKTGSTVALCDLDIVNPYFRSADFAGQMEEMGIEMVSPSFAGTNVDVPALTGRLDGLLSNPDCQIIVDVGGDDAGAVAVGRYAHKLLPQEPVVLYVVSACRPITDTPQAALEILREIEYASRVKATHIVNCTNLGRETTAQTIRGSLDYISELCKISGLPLCCHAVRSDLAAELSDIDRILPVEIFVKAPWDL